MDILLYHPNITISPHFTCSNSCYIYHHLHTQFTPTQLLYSLNYHTMFHFSDEKCSAISTLTRRSSSCFMHSNLADVEIVELFNFPGIMNRHEHIQTIYSDSHSRLFFFPESPNRVAEFDNNSCRVQQLQQRIHLHLQISKSSWWVRQLQSPNSTTTTTNSSPSSSLQIEFPEFDNYNSESKSDTDSKMVETRNSLNEG